MQALNGSGSPAFFIGTSGWSYDHWRGDFYPREVAKSRWFEYYAGIFNSVEVNATFYRFFKDETYLNWKERAPRGFAYVLKAPQLITHRKLLRNVDEDIRSFCRSADLLGDAFVGILLQLAPNQPHDPGLLRAALQAFPHPNRVAVEFRNDVWPNAETEALLESVGASYCNVDAPGHPLTEILTSGLAYLRLHGRSRWYASDYSNEELRQTADVAQRLVERGTTQVCVFFNNDVGGFAPANALTLQKLLEQKKLQPQNTQK